MALWKACAMGRSRFGERVYVVMPLCLGRSLWPGHKTGRLSGERVVVSYGTAVNRVPFVLSGCLPAPGEVFVVFHASQVPMRSARRMGTARKASTSSIYRPSIASYQPCRSSMVSVPPKMWRTVRSLAELKPHGGKPRALCAALHTTVIGTGYRGCGLCVLWTNRPHALDWHSAATLPK
jgi:hypothetical protein